MQLERRSFPRHPLKFPVIVRLNSSDQSMAFEAESTNISNASIEISCNNLLIEALLAQETYPHTCELNFNFPDQPHEFKLAAQVVTHRRLSQRQFYLVLTLDTRAAESINILGDYLKESGVNGLLKA